MKQWYDDIADDAELGRKHGQAAKRFDVSSHRYERGLQKKKPDFNTMVPMYKGPDGTMWDWETLHDMRQMRVRTEVRREMNQMRVPPVDSVRFQQFMRDQLNAKDAFADFIALPDRSDRLLEYLEHISSRQADGCKDVGGRPKVLMAHQAVVYAMANLRATDRITTPGLLAMHSTGAGKTLEGLCAMLAFWNKKTVGGRPWAIFTVSTRTNQRSNSLETLAGLARMFSWDFMNTVRGIEQWPFRDKTVSEIEAVIKHRMLLGLATVAADDDAFDRLRSKGRNNVYTYTTLSNDCENGLFRSGRHKLRHSLLIVDEIQFLLNPPTDEIRLSQEYGLLKECLMSGRDRATTWVLGMTATPGSTSAEVREILKVVGGERRGFGPQTDLAVEARGLVSVAQVEGDLHHFPKLVPEVRCVRLTADSMYGSMYIKQASEHPHLLEGLREAAEDVVLSEEERVQRQEMRYQIRLDEYKAKLADWKRHHDKGEEPPKEPRHKADDLEGPLWTYQASKRFKFYKTLREASNYLLLRGPPAEMREMQAQFEQDSVWSYLAVDGRAGDNIILMVLSPKLRQIVERIKKEEGKHFVYTSDTMTLLLLATALEQKLGMVAAKVNTSKKQVTYQEGKLHFGIINKVSSTRRLTDVKRGDYPLSKWSYVARPDEQIKIIKGAINQVTNLNGDKIRVTLATKENYKGVDLKALRFIHLVEPMPDFADFIQLVGRGPRFCSHAGMKPLNKRTVRLLAYRLVVKGVEDFAQADTHVYNESIKRYNAEYGGDTDRKLQEASVDYYVFKDNLHKTAGSQRDKLMKLSCDVKPAKARQRQADKSPYRMPKSRKDALREKAKRQKALIAARRARQ